MEKTLPELMDEEFIEMAEAVGYFMTEDEFDDHARMMLYFDRIYQSTVEDEYA